MAHLAGESKSDVPRLNFDRRLKLEFHGFSVTSDAGLLPFRELDDVLGLIVIAGQTLADARTGRNGRHDLIGMLRQSVFGRLAGYEDVNDADRLGRDPAMRWIALLPCKGPGKPRVFTAVWESSGESRLKVRKARRRTRCG
jgi:Transposase DDE domain group 1